MYGTIGPPAGNIRRQSIEPSAGPGRRAVHLLVILAICYPLFFFNLGGYSLKEPDEGRYAEIPREMVEQGDYLVPRLDYVRYFEKPPLLYWACAGSYRAFGVDEWSFRLPNALAALLCVLATYFFARRRLGERTGFLSAVILATSFGFFAMARIVTIDMLFSFLLFSAVLFFYEFYTGGRRVFLYLLFADLGLATLAKGPVALVLPVATVVPFLYLEKRLSFVRRLVSAKALLLFAVIAAPWFVLVSIREKEFFPFFFLDQNVLRFLTTKDRRTGPLYYFFPVLFGGLFPWSVFIPRAVARLWKEKAVRLFLIWSAVVFTFFSVSGSKLPPYILPVFPAVSIVIGRLFDEAWRERIGRKRELAVFAAFFALALFAGLALASGRFDRLLAASEVAPVLPALRGLALYLSAVSLAALLVLSLKRARSFGPVFALLSAFSLSVAVGLMVNVRTIDWFNTTKALAREARKLDDGKALVVNYGSFDETLPFYLGRRSYIADFKGELEMGSKYADSIEGFMGKDRLVRLFLSDRPVLVVFKEKRLDRLRTLGIGGDPVLCRDGRCLIANGAALLRAGLPAAAGKAGIADGAR